ncbi:MAG TPA: hypothetical protein VG722_03660 [Tepidisphaeraceae bacterium]|nr:hypothetical protein [Tepidisphaeraceae bacterium]
MLDWITICVESIGIIIFVLWIIVPIGEFRTIYHHLRAGRKSEGDREQ